MKPSKSRISELTRLIQRPDAKTEVNEEQEIVKFVQTLRGMTHEQLVHFGYRMVQRSGMHKLMLRSVVAYSQEAAERGRYGMRKKLANDNDGKQTAKVGAKKMFDDWVNRRTIYKSNIAFARAVMKKYPVLTDEKNIATRWVPEWRKEHQKRT